MSKEFKLVPVEPTPEMLRAGLASNGIVPVYTAMLAAAPQPPALGGEPESKLIKLAAELASRRPIRSLQDLCDRQKSISTAKLIEDVEMCGDFLAAIAIDIRHCVESSRAHLAPLQAEIERWKACYEDASDKHSVAYAEANKLADQADQLKARGDELEALLPKYQRGSTGLSGEVERLTLIAREAAISSAHRYSYMPALPEDAQNWKPHEWVLEAMRRVELDALSKPAGSEQV